MSLKIYLGSKAYSSWSLRGWLALKHSGLPFEETVLRLDTPEFYQGLEGISPTKCVPALVHDTVTVWDSLAIIDYMARIAPEKYWWPEDDAAYGHARSITAEMHSGFMGLRSHAHMNMNRRFSGLELGPSVQKDVDRVVALWTDTRERFGQNGDFLFGEFSAADMMYAPVASRFKTYGLPIDGIAAAYAEALYSHPFITEWYNDAIADPFVVEKDEVGPGLTKLG
ncbi:glutathione S-transferase [Kordiimonas sediminis]|uniref:Glutathione S-transferase n=1 Tax=Kordiimonas sediminis TaxID=1735581 RepID=A0A919AJJ0_9PROT|nr:glutathione S-transferase family protein [Kordiimonas sediminis]GHF11672.1 glutathione S-transferase [Kordiimonas sediminis]